MPDRRRGPATNVAVFPARRQEDGGAGRRARPDAGPRGQNVSHFTQQPEVTDDVPEVESDI